MKRKYMISLLLCGAMLLASCGSAGAETDGSDARDSATEPTSDNEISGPSFKEELAYDYDLAEYITLPEHSAIEVSVNLFNVTDEDVEMAIDEELAAAGTTETVTGRAAQTGDTVKYTSTGVRFDTNETFEEGRERTVVIGSRSYLDGFGDNFVGANVGDTIKFTYTYPNDFYYKNVAGVTVEYTAEITEITRTTPAEFNDEFAASRGISGVTDAEGYRAYMKTYLEAAAKAENEGNICDAIYEILSTQSTVISYPEKEYDYYIDIEQKNVEALAGVGGVSVDEYIKNNYGSQEAFEEYRKGKAEDSVKKDMITLSLAREYGVSVDRDLYESELRYGFEHDGKMYGLDNIADFEKQFSSGLSMELLLNAALKKVAETAIVK